MYRGEFVSINKKRNNLMKLFDFILILKVFLWVVFCVFFFKFFVLVVLSFFMLVNGLKFFI